MIVNLLYFAQVSEKLGISTEALEVPDKINTDELLEKLSIKYPALSNLSFNIAVNQVLIKSATTLTEGSEVALLPPFAGG